MIRRAVCVFAVLVMGATAFPLIADAAPIVELPDRPRSQFAGLSYSAGLVGAAAQADGDGLVIEDDDLEPAGLVPYNVPLDQLTEVDDSVVVGVVSAPADDGQPTSRQSTQFEQIGFASRPTETRAGSATFRVDASGSYPGQMCIQVKLETFRNGDWIPSYPEGEWVTTSASSCRSTEPGGVLQTEITTILPPPPRSGARYRVQFKLVRSGLPEPVELCCPIGPSEFVFVDPPEPTGPFLAPGGQPTATLNVADDPAFVGYEWKLLGARLSFPSCDFSSFAPVTETTAPSATLDWPDDDDGRYAWCVRGKLPDGGMMRFTPWQAVAVERGEVSSRSLLGTDPLFAMADEVNAATGNWTFARTDVELAGVVDGLAVSRRYNSADDTHGAFGKGWAWTFDTRLVEDGDERVLYLGDGERVRFGPGDLSRWRSGWLLEQPVDANGFAVGGLEAASRDGSRLIFDTEGSLLAVRDSTHNFLNVTEPDPANPNVTGLQDDVSQRSIRLVWAQFANQSGSGVDVHDGRRIVRAEVSGPDDAALRTWDFAYTNDGTQLSQVCDSRPAQTVNGQAVRFCEQYGWNSSGLIERIFDYEAAQTTAVNYADGRVTSIVRYPDAQPQQGVLGIGNTTTFDYGSVPIFQGEAQTTVTDPRGHDWRYTFDIDGQLIRKDAPDLSLFDTDVVAEGVTTYRYADGRRSEVAAPGAEWDGSRVTISFEYDDRGNLIAATNELGETTAYHYAEDEDPDGRVVIPNSSLLEVCPPNENGRPRPRGSLECTQHGYQTVTTGDGTYWNRTSTTEHLRGGNNSVVATTRWRYNSRGQVVSETAPAAPGETVRTTWYVYAESDSATAKWGDLVRVIRPDGGSDRFEYNAWGQVARTFHEKVSHFVDPASGEAVVTLVTRSELVETHLFDPDTGAIVQTRGPETVNAVTSQTHQRVVEYDYDANRHVWRSLEWDAVVLPPGQTIDTLTASEQSALEPLKRQTRFYVDRLGREYRTISPSFENAGSGALIRSQMHREFDANGNVTAVCDGTQSVVYRWYINNNRQPDPSVCTVTEYDARNQPVTITRGTAAISGGQVSNTTVLQSRLWYWDNGLLHRSADVDGDLMDYRYDAAGREIAVSIRPGFGSSQDPSLEVTHAASCLAGNGRVDTMIVNRTSEAALYRIEFEGLSPRQFTVQPGDWWRIPITGRPDRAYDVVVTRDGEVVSNQAVTVACDNGPNLVGDEVTVIDACRAGNGYVLFQFLNNSAASVAYVIEFENVPNRSTTAGAYGQTIRAVTGRPDGNYDVVITAAGGRVVFDATVTVDCDPDTGSPFYPARTTPTPFVTLSETRYRPGTDWVEERIEGAKRTSFEYGPNGTPAYVWEHLEDSTGRVTRSNVYADGRVESTVVCQTNVSAGSPSCAGGDVGDAVTTAFTYNAGGYVDSRTDDLAGPDQRTTRFGRDERGNLTSVTNPLGNTTNFVVDALNRTTTVSYPPVNAFAPASTAPATMTPVDLIGFDAWGNVIHTQDPAGQVTTSTFDKLDRISEIVHPQYTRPFDGETLTPTEKFRYDRNGNLRVQTDRKANTTVFTYDYRFNAPRLVSEPAALAGGARRVTTNEYAPNGNLVSVRDPQGAVTRIEYDYRDLVIATSAETRAETLSDGTTVRGTHSTTRTYYDDHGRPVRTIDPIGAITEFSYDDFDRLVSQTLFGDTSDQDQVSTWRYTIHDQTKLAVTEGGFATQISYDNLGRVVSRVDGRLGSPGASSVAEVVTSMTYGYDANDNLKRTTTAAGREVDYGYDSHNRMTGAFVGGVRASDQTPLIISTYGYDIRGNHVYSRDGNNNVTLRTYNAWGLLEDLIEPPTAAHSSLSQRTFSTSYNAAGEPDADQLPGGIVTTRSWDAAGWLRGEYNVDETVMREHFYDAVGNLDRTVALNANGSTNTVEFRTDDRGLVVETTGDAGRSTMAYDPAARLRERSDPGVDAPHEFFYTERGELARHVDPVADATATYGWDQSGRLEQISWDSGAERRFDYHDDGQFRDGRLRTDAFFSGGAAEHSATYFYDVDNNVRSETRSWGDGGSRRLRYAYDAANRLDVYSEEWSGGDPGWSGLPDYVEAYDYDRAGNRRERVTQNALVLDGAGNKSAAAGDLGVENSPNTQTTTTTWTYDQRNRLLNSSEEGNYSWTARGTLLAITSNAAQQVNTYDALGQLTTASGVTYTYDGLGRLATRGATAFDYAAALRDPTGIGDTNYGRTASGRLVSQQDGGDRRLAGIDRYGDLTTVHDLAGQARLVTRYGPFGEPRETQGPDQTPELGFQGDYTDPTTGDVHADARWYSPTTGTFNSRDTYHGTLQTPLSLNRYTYANNNPVTYWDPSGNYASTCQNAATCAAQQAQLAAQYDLNPNFGSGQAAPSAPPSASGSHVATYPATNAAVGASNDHIQPEVSYIYEAASNDAGPASEESDIVYADNSEQAQAATTTLADGGPSFALSGAPSLAATGAGTTGGGTAVGSTAGAGLGVAAGAAAFLGVFAVATGALMCFDVCGSAGYEGGPDYQEPEELQIFIPSWLDDLAKAYGVNQRHVLDCAGNGGAFCDGLPHALVRQLRHQDYGSDAPIATTTLFSSGAARTNADVLENGGGLPLSRMTVDSIAARGGVGLDGVGVRILTGADDIRYLDSNGAAAFASDGTIYLGPAAFVDEQTLLRTLAHERTHIYQQEIWLPGSGNMGALEDAAYGIEDTFWAYYRRGGS